MSLFSDSLTIVVRECGERTADACVRLLEQVFPGTPVHRVTGKPFQETLRRSLQMGIDLGLPWTLCIDADVLVMPELGRLVDDAFQLPENIFEIQGLVFDKLLAAPRAAGNHLYRTRLLSQAIPLIHAEQGLRPEAEMIQAMAGLGYRSVQSQRLIGLHDFEQFYRDVYAKCFLHGHKHQYLRPLLIPLWQSQTRRDADYRVALAATEEAAQHAGQPCISREFRREEAQSTLSKLELQEKPEHMPELDTAQLYRMQSSVAASGVSRDLGKQISSVIEHGLFGTGGTVKSDELPHVVMLCSNAYPHFDFAIPPAGGGMEARAALFGRALERTDRWRLSFVVGDFGQAFHTRHEGIDFHIYQPVYRAAGRNVFPRLRKRRWLPVLNLDRRDLALLWQIPLIAAWLAFPAFFFPRFWRNMKPDVVCCFGNNAQSAEVIADCRRLGIPTVLCLASDKDIAPDYRADNKELNHYGMPKWKGHYALMNAGRIIAQSEKQRAGLLSDFGRHSTLVRNPMHVAPDDPERWPVRRQRQYVLWIGRSDDFNKRPMLFLKLAMSCPDLPFLMIVSRTDEMIFRQLQLDCPDNLRIVEHVPHATIPGYMMRARVFVNTSRFEGFPNTFLQAAAAGAPVVSMEIDPDAILSGSGCGLVVGDDPDALRQAVLDLWADDAMSESYASANHRYALRYHETEGRAAEFETSLREAIGTPIRPVSQSFLNMMTRFVK